MATINTNDLRIKNARDLRDSFVDDDGLSTAYVFAGRVQPWPDDNAPPVPQNNFKSFNTVYNNLFALNRITKDTDTYFMIPRINWVTGVVYDYYRQDYTSINKAFSGASNLYDCRWVVRNQQNNVYVCLDNNNNTPSTVEPLNTSDEPFNTTDGYQWQRVFNFTSGVYQSKTTDNFMPIEQNDVVSGVDGAISTIIIENQGGEFTNNPIGAPNQIPFYFCSIDGDGRGAVAKVTVQNDVVTKVEVVRAGAGYTFGTLNFTNDNCYENLSDYDSSINPLKPGGDGTLRTTVIVPPPGGWGTDLQRELGGTRLGVFSSLNYNLFQYVTGSFRQVGILQDMSLVNNIPNSMPPTISGCYAVQVTNIETGRSYVSGETITQVVLDADNNERIAKGIVISYDTTSGVIRYSQNSSHVDVDGNLYRFGGERRVIGLTSELSGAPTTLTGESTFLSFVGGYSSPNIVEYSGLMPYLANISPVARDPNQTERISLLIAF